MNVKKSNHYKTITIILSFIFLIKLIVVFWGINKGIDILDEGCYLLFYQNPFSDPHPMHEFHTILAPLFNLIGLTLKKARLLKVLNEIIILIIALFTIKNILNFLDYSVTRSTILFATLFLFLGLFCSIFSRSISYNGLLYVSVSLSYFGGINYYIRQKKLQIIWLGFLTGFSFFVRFPVAIILFLFVLTLIIFIHKRKWIFQIPFFLTGIFIATTLFLINIGMTPINWLERFLNGIKLFQGELGYETPLLIFEYLKDISLFFYFTLPALFVFIFLIKKSSLNFAFISSYVIFFIQLLINQYWGPVTVLHSTSPFFTYSLTYYVLVFFQLSYLILVNNVFSKQKKQFLILVTVALIIAPFNTVLGSDTEFSLSIFSFLVPWFSAILVGYYILQNSLNNFQKKIIIGLIIVVSTLQFYVGYFYYPYYLPNPIFEQTNYSTSFKEPIYLDDASLHFFNEIQNELRENGFQKNDPILGTSIPGLIFMMEGYSPVTAWYYEPPHTNIDGATKWFDIYLPYLTKKEKETSFIILHDYNMEHFMNTLNKHFNNFPRNYVRSSPIFNPYSGQNLIIYSPKKK